MAPEILVTEIRMTLAQDPCAPLREKAAMLAGVTRGTACNQHSFKVGRSAFLFVGPGAKGQGWKAMFKLDRSVPQAEKLAAEAPERFEVGSTGWVTARFTAEEPLPRTLWEKWLKESYERAGGARPGTPARRGPKKA